MRTKPRLGDLPRVEARSRAEWRARLDAHHGGAGSVWLVTWKKGRGPHVSYAEVRGEALRFGWVDSRPAKLDADRSMIPMSPRRAGSGWSKVNRERVAALEAAGLMRPAGLAAVEAAKRDGSWLKLEPVDALVAPDDLRRALDAHPPAAAEFDGFPPSVKRGILERIAAAKRPETRARRIKKVARLAAEGRRAGFERERG